MASEIEKHNRFYTVWRMLIQFGFRLLYHEMAWTYDVVSWLVSLGAWRDWQRAALPFLHGRRILELGHGPGHMLAALEKAGFVAVGLDLSPQMGRLARGRAAVPLVRGMVQSLPFADGAFDAVLATFPTEYIIDPETLTAVYRVLAADGRFVIVPEGHLTGRGPLRRFIKWLFRITGQREGAFARDEATWESFQALFAAASFTAEVHQVQLPGSVATVVVAKTNIQ